MNDSKHTTAFRNKHLAKGDIIVATADGYTGKLLGSGDNKPTHGSLIVTNRAVVFYRKGWFGEVNEAIPLTKISSVEQKIVLGFRTVRLHTANDQLAFTTSQSERYQQLVAAIDAGRTMEANNATTAPTNPLDALQRLATLRSSGAISEAEFEAKKRELLARV